MLIEFWTDFTTGGQGYCTNADLALLALLVRFSSPSSHAQSTLDTYLKYLLGYVLPIPIRHSLFRVSYSKQTMLPHTIEQVQYFDTSNRQTLTNNRLTRC